MSETRAQRNQEKNMNNEKSLITPGKTDTKEYSYIPPVKLRQFVQLLFTEDVKGNKTESGRRTGVSRQRFYYYLNNNSKFKEWYMQQCNDFLDRNSAIVATQLIKNIQAGDTAAIKIYYQLGGKLISPGINVNTQLNIGTPKYYENCRQCPNAPASKATTESLKLVIGISNILNNDIKDEDLSISQMGALIDCIRKRPFWFRNVLNTALKDALIKEAEIRAGGREVTN